MSILYIKYKKALILLLLVFVFVPEISAVEVEVEEGEVLRNLLDGKELVRELRKGGYILYFRHGTTDHATFDTDRHNLSNCSTQRPLSDEGRVQMRDIGRVIEQLGIKISAVESSPYCRSIDTATLAFGRMTINRILRHTVTESEETANRQARALRKRLSKAPEQAGFNDVLSGHTANLQEAVGIWPTPEGVAIVFKPDGNNGFKYIATIPPSRWTEFIKEHNWQ